MLDITKDEVVSREMIGSFVESLGELIAQLEDAEYQVQATKDRAEELLQDATMLLE